MLRSSVAGSKICLRERIKGDGVGAGMWQCQRCNADNGDGVEEMVKDLYIFATISRNYFRSPLIFSNETTQHNFRNTII